MATREPVIGIDLGTTFSAVATVEDGKPRIIPSRQAGRLTPSMVGFLRNGERVVGEAARVLLENLPENVAFATKRFLGRRWTPELAAAARQVVPYELVEGPNGEVRVRVAGRTLPLPQVSAIVLGELKLDAQAHFGREVTKAVITVPANFDDGQRQATKEAAAIAGLEVLRLVNEPTAAAVAYGLTRQFQGRALVFDLGGGTFDVSILEVQAGVFEVKATGGDPNLGGEDFDNRIAEWLAAQLPGDLREAAAKDSLSMGRLKLASERAKRELTTQQEAVITLTELGDHASGERRFADLTTVLTRGFFEQLSDPLYRRCLQVCQQVMADAKLDPKSVDAVLLVGGMTRVPLVRRLVTEFFGKEPVAGLNPDEVVALGAAVHASELASKDGAALLIDVATHSLGVGMLGGMVRRLIPKNTSIPVVARDIFLPGRAGQREARIAIYQGEGETVDSSTKVGEVLLKDLQGLFRSDNPIEVTFEMSTEGTLTVRATDQTTGTAEALRIEARTELAPSEVDRLRKEQGDYAATKAQEDAQSAPERFRKLMERGDKLYRLLQFTARETPSPQAAEAVGSLKELLARGKTALEGSDAEQMTDVTRRLTRIINANK